MVSRHVNHSLGHAPLEEGVRMLDAQEKQQIREICAEPELGIHFDVYGGLDVPIQWSDEILGLMLISKQRSAKETVQTCCIEMGMAY